MCATMLKVHRVTGQHLLHWRCRLSRVSGALKGAFDSADGTPSPSLSLEWFFSSANTQHNAFLFTAVRLIPLWLAGFVHVTAVGLLWPFKPAQLTPVVWHSL